MFRPLIRGVAVLALYAGLGPPPVLASTVVVPDDFSTVQSAIDSGADSVQIREGAYAERPVVDHAVVLQGIGVGQRPRLAGLDIYNTNFWADPRLLSVNRIDLAGRVNHTTVAVHPRNLIFSFTECALDSGFVQLVSLDPDDVASLSFRNCRMRDSNARAYQVVMEADTIDGGVAWIARDPRIQHCWFRGGSGIAIQLTAEPHSGLTAHSRIENYRTGIYVDSGQPYTIEANTVLGCDTGIQLSGGTEVRVTDNEIRGCVIGVYVRNGELALLRNEVGECSGDGFVLDGLDYNSVLGQNTLFKNNGSGIVVTSAFTYPVAIQGNIGFGNLGWGLSVAPGQVVELGCNDWFGNGLGAVNGVAADSTDLSVEPRFCNVDSADVRLDSGSPLLGVAGCGQIGALGVGCGETATLVQRFTALRVGGGIRIVWEVAEGATASEIWLERSDAMEGGAWIRPLTERSFENRAVVELDRSADPHRTYWYRLVALEGRDPVVIGAAVLVEAQAGSEFRLMEVGPNPGDGPVRIVFALEHAAAVEIGVFDVQGRKVASPGGGTWPAGTHVVEWDGRTGNGESAPAGSYVVRYLYPGGRDRRAIVRIR